MKQFSLVLLILLCSITFLFNGCGNIAGQSSNGGDSTSSSRYFDATLPAGTISFEVLPATTSEASIIIPLGNINPPAHTIPSNHVYFYHTAGSFNIHAPAGGKVLDVNLQDANSHAYGIIVGVTSTDSYYMYHVVLNPVLSKGDTVTAGQVLGTPDPSALAFDLGVVRSSITNTFGNQNHYMEDSINGDSPLKYFVEPLKSELYAIVNRSGLDKDGGFCNDQSGKLIGNWFQSGLPNNSSVQSVQFGSFEAAFLHDVSNPSLIRVSIGGSVGDNIYAGAYYVQNGAKDPANVTTADGKVTYNLYNSSNETFSAGLLIVQMLSDSEIKIDRTSSTSVNSIDFTSNAKTYTR